MQGEALTGFRISPQQRHLWELREAGWDEASQAKCAVVIKGRLDIRHLKAAAQQAIVRHEILRTTFQCLPGMTIPMQVIEETGSLIWQEEDLSGLDEQESAIEAFFQASPHSFDPGQQSPLQIQVTKRAEDDHVMIIRIPAICADSAGLRNLVGELGRGYAAAVCGKQLDSEVAQYADLAEWQNELLEGEETRFGREYWANRKLLYLLIPSLGCERPAASEDSFKPRLEELLITQPLAARIESLARDLERPLTSILLACWQILLWRRTGQPEIEVGTAFDGRRAAEIKDALGLFARFLPVSCRLEEGLEFRELVGRIDESLHTIWNWQEYFSWEQSIDSPAPGLRTPFFPFCFEPENAPGVFSTGDLDWTIVRQDACIDRFKIKLSYASAPDGLRVAFHYCSRLFYSEDIRRLMGHFQGLLESIVSIPSVKLGELEMVSDSELRRILFEYNSTETEWPEPAFVHELFAAQVERTPDAVAAIHGDEQLTYRALNERADGVAGYLRSMGAGPEAVVGLFLERSIEMVISLLGALKSGAAYLPLDPSSPPERLSYMLEDAGVKALLTQNRLRSRAPQVEQAQIVEIDTLREPHSPPGAGGVEIRLSPDNLAYIIYTSGSTGRPKGVMLRHRSLSNYLLWAIRHYPLESGYGAPVHSPLNFDLTITSLFAPLLVGGYVHLLSTENEIEALGAALRERRNYCLVKLTPAHLQLLAGQLAEMDFDGLPSSFVIGGENLPAQSVGWWRERSAPTRYFNEYGPTETVVGCSVYEAGTRTEVEEGRANVPIGGPIANTRLYILDERQRPTPQGIVGELYIGGEGLARGYLNNPELTAEKFVPAPYPVEAGARLYRTGDLARYLRDGQIECLGRLDGQVKIRGYRIEPGEIEARLASHLAVREAAVAAHEDQFGGKSLAAYYTLNETAETAAPVSAETLRADLRLSLPEYMIPAVFIRLDSLPLTPNGKVDRQALPALETNAGRGYEPPVGEVEIKLAEIWADLLKLERVGRQENFFELGGHSLLAIQVRSRLAQKLAIEVAMADLFKYPILADLARAIEGYARAELAPITRVDRNGRLELSFAQQRLWFLSQFEGASEAYHIAGGLRLLGSLDRAALRRALDRIVARHEVLRTTFSQVDGRPVQIIGPAETGFLLREHDLRFAPDRSAALERLAADEAGQPFDLEHGPLIRGRLAQLDQDDHALLVTMHHIVSDGWSMGILINELSQLYRAFCDGRTEALPSLPAQYADYAAWQRSWLSGELWRKQAQYWEQTLAGAPAVLELPADRPRPAQQDYAGEMVEIELDEHLTSNLKSLGRRHGATLYMTLLAGWAALLGRLSGQEEMVIGTPAANRTRPEIEPLIGFFVNTLALRIDLGASPTVSELLARVKTRTLEAQQYQDLPFEQVVEIAQPARSLAHSPIFQTVFAWQNAPEGALDLPGLTLSLLATPHVTARFDVTLSLREAGQRIVGCLEYATALFDCATVKRFVEYWRTLLGAMTAGDEQAIDRAPLLGETERRQILVEWNATDADYPRERCVHELFEAQAEKTPTAIALVHGDRSLTYGELNAQANRLARRLLNLGLKPEDRIAIRLERSIELVVAQLAALKCGAVYVPIDPAFPAERQIFMTSDCAAQAVITTRMATIPGPLAAMRVDIDDPDRFEAPSGNPKLALQSEMPAYVMYTSGSTGQPKGVMVPHRAIGRLVLNCGYADFNSLDRVAFAANPAFDAATMEVWAPLLNGGRIVVIDQRCLLDPALFGQTLERQGVSVLWLTAGLFNQYTESLAETFGRLRYLIVGGEALDPQVIAGQLYRCPPWRLVNGYGPTETTTFAITHEIREVPEGARSIPLGQPISNTRIYILDVNRQPVPIGVAGEIYIGGAGVAKGYLNRPDLTEEKFLPDPFSQEPESRMYRTGDLGRWLPDGKIEFLGRNDFQIKIRGFRVELGEIEAALTSHAQVREAVVVAREDRESGKRLVAYYTGAEIGAETLRSHLLSKLPDYMTPAAYIHLEALPLTENGKLDRRALPDPGEQAYITRDYEPPIDETETRLAGIWADLLKLERVGRRDNFFELGGHSLLAIQLLSRVRQSLGVEVRVADLFARPVLSDLALTVDRASQAELPPIIPIDRSSGAEQFELSFSQQRLWFLTQFEGASEAYYITGGLRLSGALDREALRRALDRIVARHEALRTTFIRNGDRPAQIIGPVESGFDLQEADLRPALDPSAALERLAADEAARPFDLEHGPLIRGQLAQLADDDHALLVTMHHIISDGWSLSILINELSHLYRAYLEGRPEDLPDLPAQYADYAAWQRRWLSGEVFRRQAAYWKQTLAGAPAVLELAADRPRPAQQNYAGAAVGFELDEEVTHDLKALARRHGATLYMTLLAAWAALLFRLSGQEEVIIGTPVANRTRPEIEPLIGFFVNTLALRIDLSGAPGVTELLARIKARTLEAQQHQDLPFEQVVEIVRPIRSLSHSPIFQVLLTWQNLPEGNPDLTGLKLAQLATPRTTTQFDLTLSLRETGQRIVGEIGYATALFDRETVRRYLGHWFTLLKAMTADETQMVARLPLMGVTERRQVLEEWNATETDYPRDQCIHELFEAQVEKSPDAIALVYEEKSLTYGELNARTNELAHYLRELGVGPEARVAICMERGIELVAALLATLKAGGAYVPLDPSYPAERLVYMLEDSAPLVLLTHGPARAALTRQVAGIPVLNLDSDTALWVDQPKGNPDQTGAGLQARSLAYIIYTSGSTGLPKGVMITHRALVNHMSWMQEAFQFCETDRVLQKTPISFDASVWEFYAPLLVGAKLVMAEPGGHRDAGYLIEAMRKEEVTVLQVVPTLLRLLLDGGALSRCESLRQVFCGGEELTPELEKKFHAKCKGELYNLYGPTEATIDATYWRCGRGAKERATPIGRPISNARAYVLDKWMMPVPVGVVGELYLSGEGLGRGYFGKVEATATLFVPDPFTDESDTRMYKTGDLVRYLSEGNIEYLGRSDFQHKIRGYRIELGEIEANLAGYPGVREAVVLARADDEKGKRLVAYYTGAETGAETLRSHLSSRLPDYMTPAAYIHLEAMPLTENGKLDRRALPAPGEQTYITRDYEPPIDETETRLAGIWADLLKLEQVGRHDNFFDLGGHSLLLIELQNKLRSAFERDLRIVEMFKYPTVSGLAQYLTQGRNEAGRSLLVMERAKRRREALDRRSSRFSPAE
jgi:amino acid adenylation domain-containing protein